MPDQLEAAVGAMERARVALEQDAAKLALVNVAEAVNHLTAAVQGLETWRVAVGYRGALRTDDPEQDAIS